MPKPQQKKSILSKESRQSPSTNKSPVDEGRASLCQLTTESQRRKRDLFC